MPEIDPMSKAAECERAMGLASEPFRRTLLENLRALWIELADLRPLLPEGDFAEQFENLSKIHALVLGPASPVH